MNLLMVDRKFNILNYLGIYIPTINLLFIILKLLIGNI